MNDDMVPPVRILDALTTLESIEAALGPEAPDRASVNMVFIDEKTFFRAGDEDGQLYRLTADGSAQRMTHTPAGEVVEVFHEGARVSGELIHVVDPGSN